MSAPLSGWGGGGAGAEEAETVAGWPRLILAALIALAALLGQKLNAQMEIMAIDDARSARHTIRGQWRVYELQIQQECEREREIEIIYIIGMIMMDEHKPLAPSALSPCSRHKTTGSYDSTSPRRSSVSDSRGASVRLRRDPAVAAAAESRGISA